MMTREEVKGQLTQAADYMMTTGITFNVGPGWVALLLHLFKRLKEEDPEKRIRLAQVKVKFGELRVYLQPLTHLSHEQKESIWTLLDDAENRSTITCKCCGDLRDTPMDALDGWVDGFCSKCSADPITTEKNMWVD